MFAESWSRVSVSGIVFIGVVAIASGCFMTDCPRGGKRSGLEALANVPVRQCLSCGPKNLGHCVADSICCGQDFGCFVGTVETTICQRENSIAMPCRPPGKSCGLASLGVCAARGICCVEATCVLDEDCSE